MERDKLTIRELAPYLPYKLKVQSYKNAIFTLSCNIGADLDCALITIPEILNDVENIKPLLLPLSSLTKEIEVNGERFVPIVELLKLQYPEWVKENPNSTYSKIEFSQSGYYAKAWFSYMATKDIEIHTGFMWNVPTWITEKLYEWHIDTKNLIGRNLAVDLTTINP